MTGCCFRFSSSESRPIEPVRLMFVPPKIQILLFAPFCVKKSSTRWATAVFAPHVAPRVWLAGIYLWMYLFSSFKWFIPANHFCCVAVWLFFSFHRFNFFTPPSTSRVYWYDITVDNRMMGRFNVNDNRWYMFVDEMKTMELTTNC